MADTRRTPPTGELNLLGSEVKLHHTVAPEHWRFFAFVFAALVTLAFGVLDSLSSSHERTVFRGREGHPLRRPRLHHDGDSMSAHPLATSWHHRRRGFALGEADQFCHCPISALWRRSAAGSPRSARVRLALGSTPLAPS